MLSELFRIKVTEWGMVLGGGADFWDGWGWNWDSEEDYILNLRKINWKLLKIELYCNYNSVHMNILAKLICFKS